MTTGNLSAASRPGVYGSTPYQIELTSPSLTGTWTLPTDRVPQMNAPMYRSTSNAGTPLQSLETDQVISVRTNLSDR
jgi:hypothetical protein